MKIAHLITDLDRGGAEAMLAKLVRAQKPMNVHSVIISMTGFGVYGEELQREGFRVYDLGMRRGFPSPTAILRLMNILRIEKPDLLQTWLYHADLLGLIASRITGIRPLCWNLRTSNMDMSHYSRLSQILPRLLAKLSSFPDAIIANSRAAQTRHNELGYIPKSCHVIPNGFDTTLFRPDDAFRQQVRNELGISQTTPVIGVIARFDPSKDYEGFLNAAITLAQSDKDVHFVLAGLNVDADNPVFLKTTQDALAGRVSLLGPRQDINRLMNAFDVFCLPSAFGESFPNVIGEAMACGVPCVATDVGDSSLIVCDTGRIVPPRDPAALAKALLDMLALPRDQRRAMGSKARQIIATVYSLDAIAKLYHKLYGDLIAERRAPLK